MKKMLPILSIFAGAAALTAGIALLLDTRSTEYYEL